MLPSVAHPGHQLRNLTPERLVIAYALPDGCKRRIELAPLELRVFNHQKDDPRNDTAVDALSDADIVQLQEWRARNELEVTDLSLLGDVTPDYAAELFGRMVVLSVPVAVVFALVSGAGAVTVGSWVGASGLLVYLLLLALKKVGRVQVNRLLQQWLSLLAVLLIGGGIPLATLFYLPPSVFGLWESHPLAFTGRVVQVAFVVLASLLPALLYYLFDHYRLATLRNEFEHNIFRLDTTLRTLVDLRARYGDRLVEVYGDLKGGPALRQPSGSRWPLILATLLITLGWLLVLDQARPPVGLNDVAIAQFVTPQLTAVSSAFLGAYFYALYSLSRRYARGDLQARAYSHVVVRFVVVVIFAWMTGALMPAEPNSAALLGTVFLIGVLPDTFWTVLREALRDKFTRFTLEQVDPLTELEGIDAYDRTRLEEEGVTNVQSLANHDLVDLMLATRIPVARLVDWLDQAVLCLHLPVTACVAGVSCNPPHDAGAGARASNR